MEEGFYKILIDGKEQTDLYDCLISLEVEDNISMADSFSLQLSIDLLTDGSWSLLSDDRFQPFSNLVVQAGFTNGIQEYLIDGYITQVQIHFASAASDSYLEITGMDATCLMNLEEKIVSWPDVKDSDIAETIFQSYNFVPEVDATDITHSEADYLLIQRGTDIQFLKLLARRNGFECYVEKDFIQDSIIGYFRRPVLDETPQKELVIHFPDESNLEYFDVQIDALRPLSIVSSQIDAKKKEVISSSVDASELTSLGDQSLSDLIEDKISNLVTPLEAPSQIRLSRRASSEEAELEATNRSVLEEGSWMMRAQGEIRSSLYESILKAKRLVLVKGAGELYSGKYYVTKVKHVFIPSSYIQQFEAKRNAIGLDGTEQFGSDSSLQLP